MSIFFFSLATFCTASPTADTGTSTIRSTCSVSYQRRAMPAPISGLSWWSPTITVTGLPNTLPPKSSTAICAAVTEPWPVGVEAGPFMSVSTPILTTSSEIWARADGGERTAAANAASMVSCLVEITDVLPLPSGALARCLTGSLARPAAVLAFNSQPASTELARSGGEPDLTCHRQVVTGELGGPRFQSLLLRESNQRLDRWLEKAALPHQQVEVLRQQRHKIEPR